MGEPSAFDLSFPILRHIDADVRLSAAKVTIKSHGLVLGRGAATIAVRSGKLLADIAELEVHAGKMNAQVTVNSNELLPRYTVRGKIENFDAGSAATALLGSPVITGRSTLSVDLQGVGQTPVELLRRLRQRLQNVDVPRRAVEYMVHDHRRKRRIARRVILRFQRLLGDDPRQVLRREPESVPAADLPFRLARAPHHGVVVLEGIEAAGQAVGDHARADV